MSNIDVFEVVETDDPAQVAFDKLALQARAEWGDEGGSIANTSLVETFPGVHGDAHGFAHTRLAKLATGECGAVSMLLPGSGFRIAWLFYARVPA